MRAGDFVRHEKRGLGQVMYAAKEKGWWIVEFPAEKGKEKFYSICERHLWGKTIKKCGWIETLVLRMKSWGPRKAMVMGGRGGIR